VVSFFVSARAALLRHSAGFLTEFGLLKYGFLQ
jgi:hypothetical protein